MAGKKEPAYKRVYVAIKSLIAEYRFTPGIRINAEKLSRELGVSRVPVWEAIRQLEKEGIVKNIPNRGVFFVESSLENVEEVFEVRLHLEKLIAKHVGKTANSRLLARMTKCVDAQYDAVEKRDVLAYSRLDIEFHRLLYQFAGNKLLREMLDGLNSRVLPVEFGIVDLLPDLYRQHRAVVEALQAGDAKLLDKALVDHNETLLGQIRTEMKKKERAKKALAEIGRIGAKPS